MFLKKLFFIILFAIAAVSAFGVKFDALYGIAIVLLCLFAAVSIADIVMLLLLRIEGGRDIVSKLDLGEVNDFSVSFKITRG